MTEATRGGLPTLGALRLGLLAFAAIDILLPLVDSLLRSGSLWSAGARDVAHVIIASAMAPILVVVLLFDFVMSRVRAADASGAEREHFRAVARVELIAMALLLVYWVPVVASLGR